MTDTGQVPGDGQPESAGMVEQPGVPAPGDYAYLSETTVEDEDLLLPGAQGAWGNEVAPPAPEPVVEAVHEPGAHETGGRDTGSVDLSAVRMSAAPVSPRRPLHLGPPIPSTSASPVRSLADRGPAGAPARHRAPAAGPGPSGPDHLDAQRQGVPQGAVPWGAPAGAGQAVHAAPAQAAAGAHAAPSVSAVPVVPSVPSAVPAASVTSVAPAAPAAPVVPAPAPAETAASVEGVVQAGAVVQPESSVQPEPVVQPEAAVQIEPRAQTAEAVLPGAEPVAGAVPGATAAQVQDPGAAAPGAPGVEGVPAPAPAVPEGGYGVPGAPVPEAAYGGGGAEAVQDEVSGPVPVQPADAGTGAVPVPPQALPTGPEGVVSAGSGAGDTLGGVPVTPVAPVADAAGSGQVQEAVAAQQQPAQPAPAAEPAYLYETALPADQVQVPGAGPVTPGTAQETVAEDPVSPAAEEFAPSPAEAAQVTEAYAGAVPDAVAAVPEQQFLPAPEALVPDPVAEPQTVAEDPAAQAAAPDQQPAPAPAPDAAVAPEPATEPAPEPATEPAPEPATEPAPAPAPAPEPALAEQTVPAEPVAGPVPEQPDPAGATPAGGVPLEPGPGHPLGEFVPVEGTVPTTPHLAPTPPYPIVLPPDGRQAPEPVPTVPAPRAAEPGTGPAAPADAVTHQEGTYIPAPAQEQPQGAFQGGPEAEPQAEPHEEPQAEPGTDPAPEAEAPRPAGPAAPAYDEAERAAVLKVMRERRDIRNGFRSDPIPHEVLLRVLEAAHTAPSVGHSQPWDFVVIRSAETRRSMHELAMRQRDAYAKSLPKGRAKQFKALKIEAILETPVNIVVTADPTRGGRHTLGRHTQPQMAPYSAALAVENLWLAARAEGLGVGWVSFFDEREMVRALGLPEHLEVIAYLCVGYVDEFPDEPELTQAGWSKRRPLSWVVHEETYGRRALPGEEPHDLLAETVAGIRPLDAKALGEAWERQKRMTKPAGALGMLEIISAQLSGLSRQCPPPIPEPAAVAVFAGDHGVHAQGVTPWPQEVTAQMVANFLGGGAVVNAFASQVGAEVCVVDVGVAAELPPAAGLLPRKVRAGTSDMTAGPAMTREEAKLAIEVGIETARDLVAAGNKALLTGEMGIANTTASAALIAVYTGADAAEVTGRGTGINDETLARKTEVVRRAIELHQPDPADPIGVLAAVGGFEHAAMVGLLLGGASLRTPVILDGVSAGAAALVARAIAPEVLAACIAGHRSAEPGHVAALNKLGLRPLVDLDLRLGEGTGALLALPLVQSTARAMHEVATFDSAGVTEK
jgi:nicotinate-nucleotide--dimethylbenzimidazole phosphoribosyltransferase